MLNIDDFFYDVNLWMFVMIDDSDVFLVRFSQVLELILFIN